MARTKFRVEILTPEGEVFNDDVEMVSTRTEVGSIGVLANHTLSFEATIARPGARNPWDQPRPS